VALAACAFSTYLVSVQLQLIGAVFCLVSDALLAVVACLALLRLRSVA
jgi:hypothetical protein